MLDFKGNPREMEEEPKEIHLSIKNKMELIQFSYNNRFFIFFDKILEKLIVYELCIVVQNDDEESDDSSG